MSARFSKLKTVRLTDDDASGEDREEEGEGEMEEEREEDHVRLILSGASGGGKGLKYKLQRRGKCRCSCINSWRSVLVALVAFSLAIVISLMVAKLTSEPPEISGNEGVGGLKGAVATDVPVCTQMAADILHSNGSAVDAAITALLCVGVVNAESSGIGGGGYMVVYHPNGSTAAIDFRETAPAAASVDMFNSNRTLSTTGGLSVAIPSELRGMELAHNLYGRLNWSDLFDPVIKLCKNGFNLTHHTEVDLQRYESFIRSSELLEEIYTTDGRLKKQGDLVQRPVFAAALEQIASGGADAFYTGSIAEGIVAEVTKSGGILTLDDLAEYMAELKDTISVNYNGYTLLSTPIPSGGPELLFPLNVMQGYHLDTASASDGLTYHRLVEAFKYTFGLRSQLGDPACSGCFNGNSTWGVQENMTSEDFAAVIRSSISDAQTFNISHYNPHFAVPPDDHGTSHVSILDSDGMAVSVTSTINTHFGSKLITKDGIILNNEMDDFSSPNLTNHFGVEPSEVNFISPGKRPLSSMCPVIAVKTSPGGGPTEYLITGAAGGTRIPTATAQVVLRVLSLSESLSEAIEALRLHHQLTPNEVFAETNFSSTITAYLESKGHIVTTDAENDYAVVQGIHVDQGGVVTAHSDSRKQGSAIVLN